MRRIPSLLAGTFILGALTIPLVGLRPPPLKPTLVVLVTIDQLRADYLFRWSPQWSGGFRRLLTEGATFQNGLQDHALTETAPGHATLLSGRDPASTGIVLNRLGVPDSAVRLFGGTGGGASPHRFQGSTLADWMQRADTGLRVLSVARKDRSAILPVGRGRWPVFWYSGGRFTSSTWYGDTLPRWVEAWNARGGMAALSGAEWQLLLPRTSYTEPDTVPRENGGKDFVFPHRLGEGNFRRVNESPWMDSLTLDLALEGAARLELGRRGRADLLSVGLAATDGIGHDFGPDSREIHDQLLRVDHWLGWFLDSLESQAGKGRVLLVLTGDHGVTPFPELARARGREGGFVRLAPLVREVNRQLAALGHTAVPIEVSNGLVYAERRALREEGVSPESLSTALAARIWRLPGVVDAWTPATLNGAVVANVHAARWRRNLPPRFPWLVAVQVKEGWVFGDAQGGAQHGTSNADDVDVPIAFLGPGVRAGIFPDTVRTTDIAPTLARLLGVKPDGRLDGRPIRRLDR